MNEHVLLVELVRSIVCERQEKILAEITNEQLGELYELAKAQDLTHIVGEALQSMPSLKDGELGDRFVKAQMRAMYRYVTLTHELGRIYAVLDAHGIPYMPLKGALIRAYYPSPEMRTSCDIDILVSPENLDRAVKAIVEDLSYTFERRYSHDVSLFSPSKVHLELHFDLIENNDRASEVLKDIWSTATLDEGSAYRYVMSREHFVFYHIAHMAEHYTHGGCGVRNFLDLWIAKHKMVYQSDVVERMLCDAGLDVFGKAAMKLSDVWFDGAQHDEVTKEMESYVMRSGIYGTMENRIAITQGVKGGKLRYLLGRLFLPYSKLRRYYPVLEKWWILFPMFQVVRWCDFLFRKDKRRAMQELRYNGSVDLEKKKRLQKMMENLHLS